MVQWNMEQVEKAYAEAQAAIAAESRPAEAPAAPRPRGRSESRNGGPSAEVRQEAARDSARPAAATKNDRELVSSRPGRSR